MGKREGGELSPLTSPPGGLIARNELEWFDDDPVYDDIAKHHDIAEQDNIDEHTQFTQDQSYEDSALEDVDHKIFEQVHHYQFRSGQLVQHNVYDTHEDQDVYDAREEGAASTRGAREPQLFFRQPSQAPLPAPYLPSGELEVGGNNLILRNIYVIYLFSLMSC
jgi:hypothetical protein